MKKRIALIPSYKPDEKLISLLISLKEAGFLSVVVNDGSGIEYDDVFLKAEAYASVISYAVNQGKGHALKTGLKYIKENFSCEYNIVTLDADGQHTIEDSIKVIEAVHKNPDVLVLGSRFFDKKTPLRSRFGNGLTRFIYRLSTGIKVYDTQTGLRAFSDKIIDKLIDIDGARYEYEMNVLLECKHLKIKIIEIPIKTIYIDNNSSSHFDVIKDSLRIYRNIFKFMGSSLASFFVDYILYSLFLVVLGSLKLKSALVLSNVFARIISSMFNFIINKKFVFKSNKNTFKALCEYYILVILILIGNTFLLKFLSILGVNVFLAKILTEIAFFIINWFVQNFLVFKNKKEN